MIHHEATKDTKKINEGMNLDIHIRAVQIGDFTKSSSLFFVSFVSSW
jgi:hypothetical protein